MGPRDTTEAHRAATPLELLFDLVSVIAIATAAAALHHAIVEAHVAEGLVKFVAAFFAIWWAWMNYTWFASAYDNDDVLFRVLTMIIMAGALTMAAGIGDFFESTSLRLMVVGYVIMRVAMVAHWLRAAKNDPTHRRTALWYAGGVALVQAYWVVLLLSQPLPPVLFFPLFGLGAVLELAVPMLAERHGATPWHRHHIIERYGLLNIIVLGETLLAGSFALARASGEHFDVPLLYTAIAALVILFSLWWLYFAKEDHLMDERMCLAFTWGYGHFLIYMSGAAVGAGFAALVDIVSGHGDMPLLAGDYAVAIPVALYMLGLWFVRDRFTQRGRTTFVLPVFALLVLVAPPFLALQGVAALTVLSVIVRNYTAATRDA
jgi:low temperature requirement protein LtrA